ncbi:DNA polymerase III subunit delta, partial [Nostocoides australiense]|uniref:DNA polymerase III subunit delta n=1 Tax=Nostocoides australiense TaxID=99480 RepID=UPI00069EB9F4
MSETVVAGRVPPLVLIHGPESVLIERAIAQVSADLKLTDPQIEIVKVSGTGYQAGELPLQASPSLFGESKAVIVTDADEGNEAFQAELLAILPDAGAELILVVAHKGGNRGKKIVDSLKAAKARVIDTPAIKSDRDKQDFTVNEFRRAGRKTTPDAIRALIEAVGSDIAELASACQQLISDTTGTIDEHVVAIYHGGKVEATGFRVADAAIAGDAGEALRLLRHAIATGLDPVPIVAVLASQLRQV